MVIKTGYAEIQILTIIGINKKIAYCLHFFSKPQIYNALYVSFICDHKPKVGDKSSKHQLLS